MRTARVTGAARGIGAATVRRLVETGHRVVALDWCAGDSVPGLSPQATRADLESLASAYDGQVLPLIADVREPTALTQAVDLALERAGQLDVVRSEEHTSELQSLMRISYAVFCFKKNINHHNKKSKHYYQ